MDRASYPTLKRSPPNTLKRSFVDQAEDGREIGVEVRRGEDPLPPHGHPGHLAARDDHDPSRIKGDPLRVDAAQTGIAASEFQPLQHVGVFHKSEMQGNPGDAGADRDERYALVGIDARRGAADRLDQQDTLVPGRYAGLKLEIAAAGPVAAPDLALSADEQVVHNTRLTRPAADRL